MPNFAELERVFDEARLLVNRDGNDFSWSGWDDAADATLEVDGISSKLDERVLPDIGTVLFLPTGPLQELSLSSGWGDEFIRLADWFDEAAAGTDCNCFLSPLQQAGEFIGVDDVHAEVSIATCPACGVRWVRYLYEFESQPQSGRWYMGALPKLREVSVDALNSREVLGGLPWYFCGGSYFGGDVIRSSGPVLV